MRTDPSPTPQLDLQTGRNGYRAAALVIAAAILAVLIGFAPSDRAAAVTQSEARQELGEIAGSAIFDDATNTLSFVATGGVLAPDSYSVFFVSGSNAFKEDGTGALLDGNADGTPGDNFVAKLLGKTAEGKLLFGYAQLPWLNYLEPALSPRLPRLPVRPA